MAGSVRDISAFRRTGEDGRLKIAVLTGSDAPAILACLEQLATLPTVEMTGIIFDAGIVPLRPRLRRLWKRTRRQGLSYLVERLLQLMLDCGNRLAIRHYNPDSIRRAVFPNELRSVRDFCRRRQIRYIGVADLNSLEAQTQLRALDADLGVVIGTRILRAGTFTIPRLGSINLHKGRVPDYRGQPPGFWELYNGETQAGATVHVVVEKLDAGPILGDATVPINIRDTPHSLRGRLDTLGATLLRDTVAAIAQGRTVARPQPPATRSPYTTPTTQQELALARRLGIDDAEHPISRFLKRLAYAWLLFGGPVGIRNLWLRLRRRTRYTVLLYHRVNDVSQDKLTTSVNRFIEHLALLRRHYPVVALADALRATSGRYLGPNVVVVTFDDGYADNAEAAAPVLRHFGLPATFFVTAGLVGTKARFPHDDGSPYHFANLSWDQVRGLRDAGFEIGSHGLSHRNLARCSLAEARHEILRSRDLLEGELGTRVRTFAYPFGARSDITPEVIGEIRSAGFDAIASAYGGANLSGLAPDNILRSGVSSQMDAITLRAQIEGVALGALRERLRTAWTSVRGRQSEMGRLEPTFDAQWRQRFERYGQCSTTEADVSGWSDIGLSRRVDIFSRLLDSPGIPSRGAALDLGCGAGTYSRLLAKRGYRVVGLDYSVPSLGQARQHDPEAAGRYLAGDAYALPFDAARFDLVVCIGVLQTVGAPELVLDEAARVLRPGGVLVVEGLNSRSLAAVVGRAHATLRRTPARVRRYDPGHFERALADRHLRLFARAPIVIPPRRLPGLLRFLDLVRLGDRCTAGSTLAEAVTHSFLFAARLDARTTHTPGPSEAGTR